MRTVERTVHVAELLTVEPAYDVEKFAAMLVEETQPAERAIDPDNYSKGMAWAIWYHSNSYNPRAPVDERELASITVFSSYRRPFEKFRPPCYYPYDPRGTLVATGTYKGEPGEWWLYKRGNPPKAPYEK